MYNNQFPPSNQQQQNQQYYQNSNAQYQQPTYMSGYAASNVAPAQGSHPHHQQQQHQHQYQQNGNRHNGGGSSGLSFNSDQIVNRVQFYLSPRQRLNTLFAIHAACSLFIGIVGYMFPSTGSLFFLTESRREKGVARVLIRLYCCLIAAQGIMIWRARKINEGEIKRAFVQAYFICFLFSTFAIIYEHMNNMGVVSGKTFGILKIVVMIALTLGYAWFTFFQPPSVFHGLGESHKRY